MAAAGFLVEGTSLSFASLIASRSTLRSHRKSEPRFGLYEKARLAKPRPHPGASAYLHSYYGKLAPEVVLLLVSGCAPFRFL